jgi:hypothetical protein
MLIQESARFKGTITMETRRADTGELIPAESCVVDNIVVDVGLAELARKLNGESLQTGVTWEIAVGTSSTAAAATDTALGTQVFKAAITTRTRTSASIAFKLFIDTTQANGHTLTEAGLLHDGVLIDRAILSASIVKDSSKNVTVTVQLTLSR